MIFVDDVDVNNTPKIKIDMHVKVVKIIDGFIQMILAFSSFRVFFSSFQLFIFRKSQMIGFMGFLKRHIFLVIWLCIVGFLRGVVQGEGISWGTLRIPREP